MPTAQNFNASAKGNGFPFCLERVDVSGFDYWSTLSGFNKESGGTPSAAQISLSLQNAWRLYWMIYGVTGIGDSDGTPFTFTIDADNDLSAGEAKPFDRLCMTSSYGMEIAGTQTSPSASMFRQLESDFYSSSGGIVRMYDGATTNEANFLGYGIQSTNGFYYSSDSDSFYLYIDASSYRPSPPKSDFKEIDIQYTKFQGIPVVGYAEANGDAATADAAALTASVITTTEGAQSITIDSIKFYTT